jgi:mannose-1-phosphate guanylyltransferase
MSYRRKKEEAEANKKWEAFIAENQALISKIGLPEIVIQTQQHWTDFLMHGYLDHHDEPTNFSVDELDKRRHKPLKELAIRYFEAGYSYFTPMALLLDDQQEMSERFEKRPERE